MLRGKSSAEDVTIEPLVLNEAEKEVAKFTMEIEKKYLNSIIERESWDELIYKKISGLLNRRQTPL
jgi:hypothetical protein